jgi:hypothetical protein
MCRCTNSENLGRDHSGLIDRHTVAVFLDLDLTVDADNLHATERALNMSRRTTDAETLGVDRQEEGLLIVTVDDQCVIRHERPLQGED